MSTSSCDDFGPDPSTWKGRMYAALQDIQPPGQFATSAVYGQGLPSKPLVTVTGAGPVSIPLSKEQGAALLAAGEPAPYGKGMATVYDENVRRATQLAPELVTPSQAWTDTLSTITKAVAQELGVDPGCPAEARLYKVLVYQPGGHFAAHRDTEKEPGMFATLVVQLPVQGGHTGGSLEVRGPTGTKYVWETGKGSDKFLQYCAFYADMEHQLSPITTGLRVCLVYNLVRTGSGPRPQPPGSFSPAALEVVAAAVKEWEGLGAPCLDEYAKPDVNKPALLALSLEHKYTTTNFSIAGLKGRDQALVGSLRSCPGLDVYLALVTKRVIGEGEMDHGYDDGWGRGRRFCGDPYDEEEDEDDEDDGEEGGGENEEPEYGTEEYYLKKYMQCEDGNFDIDVDDPEEEERAIQRQMEKAMQKAQKKAQKKAGGPLSEVQAGSKRKRGPQHSMSYVVDVDYSTHWVSATGSNPKLRNLDPDKDFLGGRRLFKTRQEDEPDTDPDDEEYEGYTGNAGPTVEYLYHRAAVVFWPRSRSVEMAKSSGLAAMLDLVAMRLAAGDPKQAASDMATVLQLVEAASANTARDQWGYVRHSISRSSNDTMTAWELVLRLAQAGEAACEKSEAVRMGAQLVRIARFEGIPSAQAAEMLAQAAAVLDSEDIDTSIVSLVQACGAKQVQPCLQLVVATRATKQWQQRLYTALITALGIHVQGGRLPASLSGPDILALARVLLNGTPGVQRALTDAQVGPFVEAVLARSDKQAHLQALLKEQVVRQMAKDPRVSALVRARISELEARTSKGPPQFSWAMPQAELPGYPQVQAFLRGPTQQQQFACFNGIGHARNWASKYFGSSRGGSGYSATAEAGGRGNKAYCIVTKTKGQHSADNQLYKAQLAELADVRSLL